MKDEKGLYMQNQKHTKANIDTSSHVLFTTATGPSLSPEHICCQSPGLWQHNRSCFNAAGNVRVAEVEEDLVVLRNARVRVTVAGRVVRLAAGVQEEGRVGATVGAGVCAAMGASVGAAVGADGAIVGAGEGVNE